MNVFENAIKYTERGWVRVKLEAQDINETSQPDGGSESNKRKSSMVTLTITDTGKGKRCTAPIVSTFQRRTNNEMQRNILEISTHTSLYRVCPRRCSCSWDRIRS